MTQTKTQTTRRVTVERPSRGIIVVGTSMKDAYPMITKQTCGCGHELMVLSSLPKEAALKFDRCSECYDKQRSASLREKLSKQFDALPAEVKAAWDRTSQAARAELASRRAAA